MNSEERLKKFIKLWRKSVLTSEENNWLWIGNNAYVEKVHKNIEEILNQNQRLKEENKDLKEKVILLRASEPMLELRKYYDERDKLKDNWNKLEEFAEEKDEWCRGVLFEKDNAYADVLSKMHEIGGSNE